MPYFQCNDGDIKSPVSRAELMEAIEDLYGRIDDEEEKKLELESAISRADRAIERFSCLIAELKELM